MNNPPNLTKGAIPLDKRVSTNGAASEAGQAKASQEKSEQAKEQAFDPATIDTHMAGNLGYVYQQVRKGFVKGLALVFVDDSGVPQSMVLCKEGAASALLAGVVANTDNCKGLVQQEMAAYREYMKKLAEAEAAKVASEAGQAKASQEKSEQTTKSTPAGSEQPKH